MTAICKPQKRQGLLNLDPEYQRGFVWDKAASSRLVETILLGLPVPEVHTFSIHEIEDLCPSMEQVEKGLHAMQIWVHEHPSGSGRLDIVDGKQVRFQLQYLF